MRVLRRQTELQKGRRSATTPRTACWPKSPWSSQKLIGSPNQLRGWLGDESQRRSGRQNYRELTQ